MVKSLLGNLSQRFKSRHRQMGLLNSQIPDDLFKIELTKQVCGALANTVTSQLGASL